MQIRLVFKTVRLLSRPNVIVIVLCSFNGNFEHEKTDWLLVLNSFLKFKFTTVGCQDRVQLFMFLVRLAVS